MVHFSTRIAALNVIVSKDGVETKKIYPVGKGLYFPIKGRTTYQKIEFKKKI